MTFDEYQQQAMSTAIYPADKAIVYPALGLCGEAGEVAEKIKKTIRDASGEFTDERRKAIALEIGDVLWYAAALARDLGTDLGTIAAMNLAKLKSRSERSLLHGEGDNR